jgi:hypothetical protein
VSSYSLYEDAKNGFKRAFQTAYKKHFPNSPEKKVTDVDISVEFAASHASKKIAVYGMNALSTSTNQAAKQLIIRKDHFSYLCLSFYYLLQKLFLCPKAPQIQLLLQLKKSKRKKYF